MPFPVTIDLMALAADLEKGGKRKLRERMKSAWRAQSCLADLHQANDICGVLDRLAQQQQLSIDNAGLVHIHSALMTTAILLYARATYTSGSLRERGSIQLRNLTEQQNADHQALIKVRNSALGHVETSAAIAGDLWHADYVFAKLAGPGLWSFASGSTAIGLNLDTVAALKRQLPVAIDFVRARSHERLDAIQAALAEIKPSSATMMRHQVDPVTYFGSLDTARRMLAGKPGEESTAWIPLV